MEIVPEIEEFSCSNQSVDFCSDLDEVLIKRERPKTDQVEYNQQRQQSR